MNDKIATIVMFWTLMLIMINGFIAVSGELKTVEGNTLSTMTLGDINALGQDWNKYNSYTYSTDVPGNSSVRASGTEGINVCSIVGLLTLGLGEAPCNSVADSYIFINTLVFGTEIYMLKFALLFPDFGLIFYGITLIALALKGLFIIYIGVIVRQLLGRSQ